MSYTYMANKKACSKNDKGFIYALVDLDEKATWDLIEYSDDKEYYLNNKVSYVGLSSNPIERFGDHRTNKGKKIGMVIFDQAKNPAEGKMKESIAIFKLVEKFGKCGWQKGAETWAGA